MVVFVCVGSASKKCTLNFSLVKCKHEFFSDKQIYFCHSVVEMYNWNVVRLQEGSEKLGTFHFG